ncbi:MAG: hypothetical protein ACXVNM_13210, partial [Bacteroidia bacterium]
NKTLFVLKPLESVDDITALVTPPAKDDVIDSDPLYSSIVALDKSGASNQDNQKEFERILYGNKSQGPEIAPELQQTAKTNWEAAQKQNTIDDLNKKYEDLYFLFPDRENWEQNKMGSSGYNDKGEADAATIQALRTWITTKGKDPADYIKDGDDPLTGWKIDEIKRDILVSMSTDIINDQKWQPSPESVQYQDDWNKAGNVKDEYKNERMQKDGGKIPGVAHAGRYSQAQQKRYPRYNPLSGYVPDKTSSTPMDEFLTWIINYQAKVKPK